MDVIVGGMLIGVNVQNKAIFWRDAVGKDDNESYLRAVVKPESQTFRCINP